jgi:hypothetical protein
LATRPAFPGLGVVAAVLFAILLIIFTAGCALSGFGGAASVRADSEAATEVKVLAVGAGAGK